MYAFECVLLSRHHKIKQKTANSTIVSLGPAACPFHDLNVTVSTSCVTCIQSGYGQVCIICLSNHYLPFALLPTQTEDGSQLNCLP